MTMLFKGLIEVEQNKYVVIISMPQYIYLYIYIYTLINSTNMKYNNGVIIHTSEIALIAIYIISRIYINQKQKTRQVQQEKKLVTENIRLAVFKRV